MSKITKPSSNKARRRRPNKKLVATLDSLAAALPDEDTQASTAGTEAKDQVNVIRRKSMKSRPGAMKRREKIDLSERERFARNMAQMAASTAASNSEAGITGQSKGPAAATSQRWAALRGFIAQTLEQKPELKPNVQN
jgi:Ribosome biogenesis protein SLX9